MTNNIDSRKYPIQKKQGFDFDDFLFQKREFFVTNDKLSPRFSIHCVDKEKFIRFYNLKMIFPNVNLNHW